LYIFTGVIRQGNCSKLNVGVWMELEGSGKEMVLKVVPSLGRTLEGDIEK